MMAEGLWKVKSRRRLRIHQRRPRRACFGEYQLDLRSSRLLFRLMGRRMPGSRTGGSMHAEGVH